MKLAERTGRITPPGTSRMRELANELKRSGVDVINFAAGELDGDASEFMKEGARRAIDEGQNKYTPTIGTKELRQRIADAVSRRCGVPYGADEVAVTAGAKQALFNAAMVLLNPGDEVIIPQPYWVTFPVQVEIAGAKAVFVDTAGTGYQLSPDALENAITPATKAIILNSPNNPTGVVYAAEALQLIAQLALRRQLWVIFDECYSELVRPGASHYNVVQLVPEMKHQTILVNSFSKSHAVTGWRLGYACAPAHVVTAMENLQGHTTSNPSTLAQHAAAATLRDGDGQFLLRVNAILDERLRMAREIVGTIKDVHCAPAAGAFYLFLDVQGKFGKSYRGKQIADAHVVCELMLSEAHVAVVAGDAFGDPTGLRVSYAIATRQVDEGLRRMKQVFDLMI